MTKIVGTFTETSMPVVKYYRDQEKVVEVSQTCPLQCDYQLTTVCLLQVDATESIPEVYAKVKIAVDAALASKNTINSSLAAKAAEEHGLTA